jgi:perosamine synthetase
MRPYKQGKGTYIQKLSRQRIDGVARLAQAYGKSHAAMVATGTAAIEVGLKAIGVQPGDRVLVPTECCFLIPASVLRIGAKPVFVPVGRKLVLEPGGIANNNLSGCKAIIAVHTYGLPCDIQTLREQVGNTFRILEDASLAWNIRSRGYAVGTNSDVVVASFGTGKPVSLLEGGGAFSNEPSIGNLIDRVSPQARFAAEPPMPYGLSPYALEYLTQAMDRGYRLVRQRRELVSSILARLVALGLIPWEPAKGDRPAWHRLPLWAVSSKVFEMALRAGSATRVVQTVHATPVEQLPMFKECECLNNGLKASHETLLLLRLDDRAALEMWLCYIEQQK